jgi:HSP20 family protein
MSSEDIFTEIDREIRALIEDTFSGIEASMFDLEQRCLRPLYRIEVNEREVIVIFDLPYAEKESIELNATEDELEIKAKMRRPVSIMIGGPVQRRTEFEKYLKKIKLPVKVDPEKATAAFRNGVLTVRFPISGKGKQIKIE